MQVKYPLLLAAFCASAVQANSLVITEIMQNPSAVSDSAGEWFEVLNTGDTEINLNGWSFSEDDGNNESFTIAGDLVIKGGHYGVFAVNSDATENGGVNAIYQYSGMTLANGSDELVVFNASGIEVDRVEWDNGATFPDPTGASMVLNDISADNNLGNNWSTSTTSYGNGDQGTPNSGPDGLPSNGGEDDADTGGADDSICTNCPEVPKVADASTFNADEYYATVIDEVNAASGITAIKAALTAVISENFNSLSYTETWTVLTESDQDPENSNNIILLYSGKSIPKSENASGDFANEDDFWNREHVWPNSHGFADDGDRNLPPVLEGFSDVHHLRPADRSVNASRGNLDFDESENQLPEAPANSFDNDSFEPRDEVKGDVARMMLYMDTRYEGINDITPDLVLVDEITNSGEPRLGKLCTLLAWHNADAVSDFERNRNNVLYEYQGNRNPFIDHPEWVELLYPAASCSNNDNGGDNGDDDNGGGTGGDAPINLFISEYIEGSGNNKAIEIYNNSSQAVDLTAANVALARFSNGSSSGTNIVLTGTIPANGTFVIVNTSANADFKAKANQLSGSVNHNGDDAYTLSVDGVVIDSFGQVGTDPGSRWGTGDVTSQNDTLIRKSSVFAGDTIIDDAFDPATQWIGLAQDTFSELGQHEIDFRELFISEYIEGSSSNKAIEIYNPNGTDVDLAAGFYRMELYANGRAFTNDPTNSLDLSGTITGGDVYVIANTQAASAILDEADVTSPVTFFNGDDALVLLKDGVPIDSIGQVGNDPGSAWTGNGVSTQNSTIVRKATITSGDPVLDDAFDPSIEWDGFPINTFDSIGRHTAGGAGNGGAPGDCCDETTLIHAVQGSSDASPLVGNTVLIEGIVTASSSGMGGFFVQEEDADADADPTTSEGIFVSYEGALPDVGSIVKVIGGVSEFFDRTQLTATEAPEVTGFANTLPTESALSLPFIDIAQAESLEGMLVSTTQALVVTDNFTLGRFGQVTLSTERLYTPTNVYAPGSDEAIDLAAANALNRILLDDGNSTSNPEDVVFPTGGLSASNTLRLGDTVVTLTGVVDFAFGDYRVIPTQEPAFVATNPRTAEPDLNLGNLKVASLNVLNYFTNIDGSGSICGPTASSSCRGADSDLEFERQKAKTVAAIVAMDADIVGLMEIENNGFAEGSAIADLVAGINAIMGAGTYSIVDPGTPIGTDAITVAFIYKPSVVSLAGPTQILDSSNSISDNDGVLFVDTRNRPSLIQEFALVENGESLVISVNHLKSKGSGCGAGDDDITTGQGNCNLTRTRAAQALNAFLDTQYPDAATLIIGDLNAYAKEDPIRALEDAGYTNLVNYFGGDEAYSYSFSGLLGYLDHALANNKALAKVVDVTEWHINADEPISLDYNVENKTPDNVTSYYADDAYRMSDHDPVLIALQLDAPASGLIASADVNRDGNINFADYMAILGMLGSVTGDANFDAIADYDEDGVISPLDLQAWYQLYLSQ